VSGQAVWNMVTLYVVEHGEHGDALRNLLLSGNLREKWRVAAASAPLLLPPRPFGASEEGELFCKNQRRQELSRASPLAERHHWPIGAARHHWRHWRSVTIGAIPAQFVGERCRHSGESCVCVEAQCNSRTAQASTALCESLVAARPTRCLPQAVPGRRGGPSAVGRLASCPGAAATAFPQTASVAAQLAIGPPLGWQVGRCYGRAPTCSTGPMRRFSSASVAVAVLKRPERVRARVHEVAEHTRWWQNGRMVSARASALPALALRRPPILPRWPRDVSECPLWAARGGHRSRTGRSLRSGRRVQGNGRSAASSRKSPSLCRAK
jgi:hypothetical protein